MKITCEGCSAKYSVADAKVRGRAFKIRCKRCGAAIVVRGESLAESLAESTAWHVMVSGAEQGPIATERVSELLAAGAIDGESYVWREGFAEWRPLREVGELGGSNPELGADLFATSSPFAPEPSEAADEVGHASSLTGTRNESSVLFSLSNLQALSTPSADRTASPTPASSPRTTASADGSGLIDIRALATTTASQPTSQPSVDDLLAIRSLGSPLGPPVILATPTRTSSRSILVAAISAVGAVLVAAVAIVGFILGGQSETRAADRVERGPIVEAPTTEPVEMTVAPTSPTATAQPEVATTPETPTVEAPATEPRASRPETPRRPRRETEEPTEPIAVRRPSDAPPPDINALLDLGANPDRQPTRREPVVARGPATPSRADVVSAMAGVAGAVRACGNGARGNAPVRIVFSGETGRVTSAEVNASSLPPDVRSCIARAARGARVPPFTQQTFRVDYPFSL